MEFIIEMEPPLVALLSKKFEEIIFKEELLARMIEPPSSFVEVKLQKLQLTILTSERSDEINDVYFASGCLSLFDIETKLIINIVEDKNSNKFMVFDSNDFLEFMKQLLL